MNGSTKSFTNESHVEMSRNKTHKDAHGWVLHVVAGRCEEAIYHQRAMRNAASAQPTAAPCEESQGGFNHQTINKCLMRTKPRTRVCVRVCVYGTDVQVMRCHHSLLSLLTF